MVFVSRVFTFRSMVLIPSKTKVTGCVDWLAEWKDEAKTLFDKFLVVNQNKIPHDFEHGNNVYGNTLSSCSKSYGVSFRYKQVICFDMCKNNSDMLDFKRLLSSMCCWHITLCALLLPRMKCLLHGKLINSMRILLDCKKMARIDGNTIAAFLSKQEHWRLLAQLQAIKLYYCGNYNEYLHATCRGQHQDENFAQLTTLHLN